MRDMSDPDASFVPPVGEPPTAADLATIRLQLGKMRYRPIAVLSRCAAGRPQVVLSYFCDQDRPDRGGPSASLYWLTCPHLRRHVDRLEASGWIRELEARLQQDEEDLDHLARDQESYAGEVRRIAAAIPAGWPTPRLDMGIGGVSDRRHLKCAHAQLSFHLAHPGTGIAGQRTLERLEKTTPRDDLLLCPKRSCPGEEDPGSEGNR